MSSLTNREAEWRKQLRAEMRATERKKIERVQMPELDPIYRATTRLEEVNIGPVSYTHLIILVATGSEVSTLVAGAELLRKEGVKVRIVSVPSEGLFRLQSKEYQLSVLPHDVKKFGLTAGLPVNLLGLVPEAEGNIWGLESFGFSAPYKVLDEKLGYT